MVELYLLAVTEGEAWHFKLHYNIKIINIWTDKI